MGRLQGPGQWASGELALGPCTECCSAATPGEEICPHGDVVGVRCFSGAEKPSQGTWPGPRAEEVLEELLEVPPTPHSPP